MCRAKYSITYTAPYADASALLSRIVLVQILVLYYVKVSMYRAMYSTI